MSVIRDVELKLISELIKNSRKSDRELAKAIDSSQPTISRLRSKLEKKAIVEYTIMPNFVELGFKLMAATFAKSNLQKQSDPKSLKISKEFCEKHPCIMFASRGQGVNSDRMAISIHRDYGDYSEFVRELDREYGEFYTRTESFLMSLTSGDISRPPSLRPLIKLLKKEKKQK